MHASTYTYIRAFAHERHTHLAHGGDVGGHAEVVLPEQKT